MTPAARVQPRKQAVARWHSRSVTYVLVLRRDAPFSNGAGFGIDIQACPAFGGALRIIACIEDPVVIEKILA